MDKTGQIPIWFFLGVLLLIYGLLITGVGIFHLFFPPAQPVALSELHPDIWWGGFLLILGCVYSIKHSPFRKN